MRRLYVKLYLAFVGVVVVCFLAAGVASHWLGQDRDPQRFARPWAELLLESLPASTDPGFEAAFVERARKLSMHVAIWDASGKLLQHTGGDSPPREVPRPGWFHHRGRPGFLVRLSDGRFVGAQHVGGSPGHGRFLWVLAVFAAVAALGCYPVARRITRRLERLKGGMDRFATGDLAARAPVQGRDEVAAVAASFNSAAARVEALVEKERGVLAAASHELRSPLARVRMAIELLGGDEQIDRAKLSAEAVRDIAELDDLIGDLLLSARAQAGAPERPMEELDLAELVAEEARRFDADAQGEPTRVVGDRRMLARLARNLLDNGRRHGGGEVSASVQATAEEVEVVVEDRGPGVPEADRERIFEPFFRPSGRREGDGSVGLGLSLVRQIAHYHRGHVHYQPREGGGSRFVVVLPRDASRKG